MEQRTAGEKRNTGLGEAGKRNVQSLPQLAMPKQPADGTEAAVKTTQPHGIADEPLLEVYITLAALLLLLGVHAWACTRCRLDRSFGWSYAAADEKPWFTRLMVQVALNLLGIYVLSLLLIHDAPRMHMEEPWFKILLIMAQAALVLLTAAVAWRSAAGGREARKHLLLLLMTGMAPLRSQCWQIAGYGSSWGQTRMCRRSGPSSSIEVPPAEWRLPNAAPAAAGGSDCALAAGTSGQTGFYGYRSPKLPNVGVDFRCPCDKWLKDLNRLLGEPLVGRSTEKKWTVNQHKLWIGLASAVLVATVLSIAGQLGPHSLAFSHFDEFVDVTAIVIAVVIVHNLGVSMVAWHMLKSECLMPLRQSPLRWGFNWIRGFRGSGCGPRPKALRRKRSWST